MPETEEVVREKSVGVTPSGKQVVREKTQVSSSVDEKEKTVGMITQLIFFLAGAIEILLGFRVIMKLLGANPSSSFVSLIYTISNIFEAPFRGIFRAATSEGIEVRSVLEPSALVAMVVYLVVAVGIVELIKLLTASKSEEL